MTGPGNRETPAERYGRTYCAEWYDRAVRAEEALRRIEALQPKALAYIEANGFVFDDIGNEPGNWKHLAFSLYSDLCEANQIAAAVVPEETP